MNTAKRILVITLYLVALIALAAFKAAKWIGIAAATCAERLSAGKPLVSVPAIRFTKD